MDRLKSILCYRVKEVFPLTTSLELLTKLVGKILPLQVSRQIAVKQSSDAASLIAGILTKDFNLMSRSMTDHIAEPLRAKLISAP